jgi:hypothetical protein
VVSVPFEFTGNERSSSHAAAAWSSAWRSKEPRRSPISVCRVSRARRALRVSSALRSSDLLCAGRAGLRQNLAHVILQAAEHLFDVPALGEGSLGRLSPVRYLARLLSPLLSILAVPHIRVFSGCHCKILFMRPSKFPKHLSQRARAISAGVSPAPVKQSRTAFNKVAGR